MSYHTLIWYDPPSPSLPPLLPSAPSPPSPLPFDDVAQMRTPSVRYSPV